MDSEVFPKIQEVLAAALGLSLDDVDPEASLTRDLGAESIDFIDIIFRLEKTFNIKIPAGELFPGNILNDERFVKAGVVTAEGLQELRQKVPYLNVDAFAKDPQVSKLPEYFTVQMVVDYIRDRVSKNLKV